MKGTLLLGALALACGSGCSAIRSGMSRALSPMTAGLADSLQREADLELVRAGAPSYILLLDGLADSNPRNSDLLLAAAEANTAYALAFLDKTDRARAAERYARARDYSLTVLRRNRRFRAAEKASLAEFEEAVLTFRKRDVPALFAAGNAWANWILARSDSVDALAQLGRAMALMRRVLDLDPDYRRGGAYLFFGLFYAVQPRGGGRDMDKSKAHFEEAFRCGGPDYLLPRVAFAEFYARYAFDRELFEATLSEVLAPREDPPEFRLMNAVARLRAQALLARVEEFF